MERSAIRGSLDASPPPPDFAEPVIGPTTSGRTRWLNPGYIFLKHQLAELEKAVCRDTQQKSRDEGCDICGRPNAMDELTHDTDSRLTPPSLKLRAFATPHVLVAASAAVVLLSGAGLGANLQAMTKGESVQWPSV
jgi:hypothetical protein